MKPVTGARMCRVLEGKGWKLARVRGSHHIYKRARTPQLVSVPVHGNKNLKPGTQAAIMRDAGLTDADL